MDGVIQKALLQLKLLRSTGEERKKIIGQIKAVDEYQLSLIAPKNFDSQDATNFIRAMEKSFENLCATLEDLGIQNPKRLTVFEFYSRIEFYKKKNKPKKPVTNG